MFIHIVECLDLDLLAGVTHDEGSVLAANTFSQFFNKNLTEQDLKTFVQMTDNVFHNIDIKTVTDFYLRGMTKSLNDTVGPL